MNVVSMAYAGNRISAEGARALAEALKVNHAVTKIDLSCERLNDIGEG